jgi:hypothetical protein
VHFKCFCKCFKHMFQVFYFFFCMLKMLHVNILKVDRGVAYEICVGSGRGHERSLHAVWERGPLLGRSLASLTLLGRSPARRAGSV